MKRREFIAALGGLMTARPIVGWAQQSNTLPTIGYLGASSATGEQSRTDAFVNRLRELGWFEGRSVNIHYRWGEGQPDRMSAIAAEFVRLNVDVILAAGTAPALACKQATRVIPIVFGLAGDPLGTGLVAGLARPGGNVTGLSNQAADLASKRLEILRELISNFKQLAALAYAGYPGRKQELDEIEQAARTLGLQVEGIEVQSADDIASGMNNLRGRCDALYVIGDPFLNSNRSRISTLAMNRPRRGAVCAENSNSAILVMKATEHGS